MSSYMVISEVSEALRHILWEAFEADRTIHQIIESESAIVFTNPTETVRDSSNRLSLWLYQVSEDEFLKNQPMHRGNGHDESRFPPLALNLFYLVAPFAPTSKADHMVLGKTLEVLYDNAIVLLVDPADEIFEELRIIFCRMTIEELTRVWEALREPYRLSVCYKIRVTRIESQRRPQHARVVERNVGFGNKPFALMER